MRLSNYETDESTLNPESSLEEIAQQYVKGKNITRIQAETGMTAARIYGMFAKLVDEPIFKDIAKVLVKTTKKATLKNIRKLLKEYTTTNIKMIDCLKKHDVNRKAYHMWIAIYKEELGTLYNDYLDKKMQKKAECGKASAKARRVASASIKISMFKNFPKKISKAEFKNKLCERSYGSLSIAEYIELARKEGIEVF